MTAMASVESQGLVLVWRLPTRRTTTATEGGTVHVIKDFGGMRQAEICAVPEEEGGYSSFVAELRGICGQGDTAEEAIRNCESALRDALEVYDEEGMQVPWEDGEFLPLNCVSVTVAVPDAGRPA